MCVVVWGKRAKLRNGSRAGARKRNPLKPARSGRSTVRAEKKKPPEDSGSAQAKNSLSKKKTRGDTVAGSRKRAKEGCLDSETRKEVFGGGGGGKNPDSKSDDGKSARENWAVQVKSRGEQTPKNWDASQRRQTKGSAHTLSSGKRERRVRPETEEGFGGTGFGSRDKKQDVRSTKRARTWGGGFGVDLGRRMRPSETAEITLPKTALKEKKTIVGSQTRHV